MRRDREAEFLQISSRRTSTMIRKLTDDQLEQLEHDATDASRGRSTPPSRLAVFGVLLVVWLIAGVYSIPFVDRAWVPQDEGLLGHTAERVLDGELPHRDFDDTYTGGLAMLNAAALHLFGERLVSIRWMFFGFAVAFVPAVYAIALRATRPWIAGLVTLVCFAWSVPNYFAALPSWYVLFFATFGVAAIMRHVETGRSRWLFVAGLCGGAAMTIKIVALYYIAAALLFLLYREQSLSRRAATASAGRSIAWSLVVTGASLAFVALLVVLIRRDLGLPELLNYVVPGALSALVLIHNEWVAARGSLASRLRRLIGLTLPFVAGAALPIAVFVAPYVLSGDVDRLLYGVFVLPMKRLQFVSQTFPQLLALLFVVPVAVLLALGFYEGRSWRRLAAGGLVFATAALIVFRDDASLYLAIWYSLRSSLPIVCAVAAWLLLRRGGRLRIDSTRRQQVFLLSASAALLGLIQYPFAAPIYFCYDAPLLILTAVFMVAAQPLPPRRIGVGVLAFYLLFAVGWLNVGDVFSLGHARRPYDDSHRLDLGRAGIRMPESEVREYEALVAEVRRRSRPGSNIYAAPDCPEVYFLADRRNPTRTMYDLFDDPVGRTERICRQIEESDVDVVVIRLKPDFSAPLDAELRSWIEARYRNAKRIGAFVVASRAAEATASLELREPVGRAAMSPLRAAPQR